MPAVCRSLLLFLTLALCAVSAQAAPHYQLGYTIGFEPAAGEATAAITLTPGTGMATRLRFHIDPKRHLGFSGDGEIRHDGDRLVWRPPADGGTLHFRYRVDERRKNGEYEARITPDWALLRIDRLIPPVAVVAPGGARSDATLRFELPPGWHVDVGYRIDRAHGGVYPIDNPGRRFQRPLGWLIAGDIGVRRDLIDDMEVAVAAPKGDSMRRNDALALLNASALAIRDAFGRLPSKLLIVGAGDPMWRGGLSGPTSFFLHSDRPMISENGTSTVLHETVHVVTHIRGAPGDDWIAEGLAEFYSIELLLRSGLITEARADKAFAWMAHHGRSVTQLRANNSAGPRTARAVTMFHALDREIRRRSGGNKDLDDVVRRLIGKGRVSAEQLREAAEAVLGAPAKALDPRLIGV